MVSFTTTIKPRAALSDAEVAECAALFSAHYGVWAARGPRPGARVTMSPAMLHRSCLFDDDCGVVLLREGGGAEGGGGTGALALVGHAFFRRFAFGRAPAAAAATTTANVAAAATGPAVWVTQLVVASGARGRRVASAMLLQLARATWWPSASSPRTRTPFARWSAPPRGVAVVRRSRWPRRRSPARRACRTFVRPTSTSRAGGASRARASSSTTQRSTPLAAYSAVAGGRAFELGPLGEGEEFIAAVVF
jgi:hypothetical protein